MPTAPTPDELKAARKRLGLTQAALATEVGASRRAVEDWEAGKRPTPPMLSLALLYLEGMVHEASEGDGPMADITGERKAYVRREFADEEAKLTMPRAVPGSRLKKGK